jgi:4-oxalocrotonate tautomerase family enzyme
MPAINISHIANISTAQKRALSKAITDAFVTIANKAPDNVWIFWHGVDEDNFASGGQLRSDTKKQKRKKK